MTASTRLMVNECNRWEPEDEPTKEEDGCEEVDSDAWMVVQPEASMDQPDLLGTSPASTLSDIFTDMDGGWELVRAGDAA